MGFYERPGLWRTGWVRPELGVLQAGRLELLLQGLDLVLMLHAVITGLLQVQLVLCALRPGLLQLPLQALHLLDQPLQGCQAETCMAMTASAPGSRQCQIETLAAAHSSPPRAQQYVRHCWPCQTRPTV